MGEEEKVHSFEEVVKHNKKDDCWLIISGKVISLSFSFSFLLLFFFFFLCTNWDLEIICLFESMILKKIIMIIGDVSLLLILRVVFETFNVYDVTPFLEEHPGGDEIMLMSTGKDATADFKDIGHSNDAEEKMKEFYIGEIDASTIPFKQQTATYTANRDSGDSSKILLYILPLLIIGVAFLLRFYSKQE
ncbi:hypothetical protein BUALT_Bualt01G0243400 [Buddleja alternifolia]|uniref:Cytochrome b5 heme-binding domain-containing protein n=1 Tax=Buddleja alternifolia TaxID=168488 RepID=A0AAV6Y9V9_9LAMI|nr:hypothetical protein BUALT_Bualt01G0243400 [Buddleja alternifolia]